MCSRKSKTIRTIDDPLQKAMMQHSWLYHLSSNVVVIDLLSTIAVNKKERLIYDDASTDPRFASEAGQTPYRSVICLPILGNRGQTFGALYVASKYPFSKNTVTILTSLCQQASVSIANALLFRSVQAGTKENLKMINTQRTALDEARRSREDALKATKVSQVTDQEFA